MNKKLLEKISRYVGLFIILLAFASLGFLTENPQIMVPAYFAFFLLVFSGVFYYQMKKPRKKEIVRTKPVIVDKIFGVLLFVVAIFMPSLIFRGVGFTFIIHFILVLLTIILIGLTILAVTFINKKKMPEILLGYIILVIICSVPAFAMMQHDPSYFALGSAYYTALLVTVLAWFGVTTILRSFNK